MDIHEDLQQVLDRARDALQRAGAVGRRLEAQTHDLLTAVEALRVVVQTLAYQAFRPSPLFSPANARMVTIMGGVLAVSVLGVFCWVLWLR